VWVIRGKNEEYDEENIVSKGITNENSPRAHVWGCFSGGGVGNIYFYDDPLTADKMKKIYKDCLWQSANKLFGVDADWWLLYDNDPRHKAQVTIQWLSENFVRRRIDFPPYSPDLNPIENLWAYLVARVDKYNAKTDEELKQAILKEWAKIPKDFLINLAHSMPKRCQEVIDHQGHKTHY
jgi:DDE superfamily endonuclease